MNKKGHNFVKLNFSNGEFVDIVINYQGKKIHCILDLEEDTNRHYYRFNGAFHYLPKGQQIKINQSIFQ